MIKILTERFVLIFKVVFCDYFFSLDSMSWSQERQRNWILCLKETVYDSDPTRRSVPYVLGTFMLSHLILNPTVGGGLFHPLL